MNIMIIEKSLSGGGAERVATNLASCLSKTEDVILVVFNARNNTYGSTVKTIDLSMPENKGLLKILWHMKARNKVKKLKKKYQITHSISFMAEPDLANVTSKGNEKVIISVRNKHSSSSPTKFHFYKNKWVFGQADAIVAISKMVKQDLIKSFGIKDSIITSVYNPCYIDIIQKRIEEDIMNENEKAFFVKNKGKIAITVGRLEPQKGQWHLIRAFGTVVDKIPDAKLVIMGQGSEKLYLENLIEDMKLGNNVLLFGYKANPYPYLASSDLFVFSSVFEGLGNILVECMACRVPVISSDYQYGARELLAPGENISNTTNNIEYAEYGVLVPPMDGKKLTSDEPLTHSELCLSDAIVKLLSDNELRNKYKIQIEKRGKDFSPENITNQWLKILRGMSED